MEPVPDNTARHHNGDNTSNEAASCDALAVPADVVARRTIVTALPLKRAARERLAQLLGARVLDVRDNCDDPDLVLSPPCSPQLIGGLQRKYNGARVVIVELEDWEFDIDLVGPVKRLLRTGASAYVLADSLDELAAKLAVQPETTDPLDETGDPQSLPAGATVDELIESFLRQSVEHAVRHHEPR